MSALAALLGEQGLDGVTPEPMPNAGFSGASLARLVRGDGARFVLKRSSLSCDWIMRSTEDAGCREAAAAAALRAPAAGVRSPAIGAVRDGEGFAVLMHDIAPQLLPAGRIAEGALALVIAGMAALHAAPIPDGVPWCDLERRLLLLSPEGARIPAAYGAPVAGVLAGGWALFEREASAGAREMIRGLHADPTPLVRALGRLAPGLLHGDLKFDNIGIDGETLLLIDWAMTMVAPPAVELGWFLAVNSHQLPIGLDAVLDGYASAAGLSGRERARHDALACVCGLLLRGWRKALDAAEGRIDELRWWCERAEAAAGYLD